MNRPIAAGRMWLLLAVGLLVTLWGIAGTIETWDWGTSGFDFAPDFVVAWVQPGGGAESAGVQVGDRLVSVDGAAAEQLGMQGRWGHEWVGHTKRMELERDGRTVVATVVYGPPPPTPVRIALRSGISGLLILWIGLSALLVVRTNLAALVALITTAWAMFSFPGPDLGVLEGVAVDLQAVYLLLFALLFLRFFLIFPAPKKVAEGRVAHRLLGGALLLLVALLPLELLLHPAFETIYSLTAFLLVSVALLLALVALAHSLMKSSPSQRRQSGLGLVAGGFFVAVAPAVLRTLASSVVPGFGFPGSAYYFFLLPAAIPLGMALAAARQRQAGLPPQGESEAVGNA